MTSSLQFGVQALKEKSGSHFEMTVGPEAFQECLSDAASLSGDLSLELDFFPRGEEVLVRGRVQGAWELECCRCLARPRSAYDARLEGVLTVSEGAVDVSEEVRQALILALPIKATCRPDCKGLCPGCRTNRNLRDCSCSRPPDFKS